VRPAARAEPTTAQADKLRRLWAILLADDGLEPVEAADEAESGVPAATLGTPPPTDEKRGGSP
jgi:hypothetical protein